MLLLMGAYVLLWVAVVVASGDNVLPVVLWGLVSVPAFICVMVWFWVRVYYLPVPALMLEPVGDLRRARPRLRADSQAVLAHLRHRGC